MYLSPDSDLDEACSLVGHLPAPPDSPSRPLNIITVYPAVRELFLAIDLMCLRVFYCAVSFVGLLTLSLLAPTW